jgi:Type I phosphodiesterase / nucleotide pyrophosphatase
MKRILIALISLSLTVPVSAPAQNRNQSQVRLIVGITIDQFRADYLTRFQDQFVEGGFRRLLSTGAVFTNANYVHTPTYTACGHATFMSGATPSMNGIIGNEWFERETNMRVTSVSDPNVRLLGSGGDAPGMSPVKLVGSTVGDEMRIATNGQAKVIGMSYKDRSAILPAGKRPNGAYWFNANAGTFVSSTYYFPALPAWVQKFNTEVRPDRYFGKKWERLLPEESYSRSRKNDLPEELSTNGRSFPYTIDGGEAKPGTRFYTRFEYTPFANEQLIEFAKTAIENEGLGADDTPDLLTISFSANDLIGHTYGPYSQEVQDVTLRTDRLLAAFFDYLDKKIGAGRTLVVLTADHGVAPIPEHVRQLGYGGRIVSRRAPDAVEEELKTRFGEGPWVAQWVNGNLYLDEKVAQRQKISMREVETAACAAVLKIEGVGYCFTRTQLLNRTYPDSVVARSVVRGFYPSRNGDVILVPQPFYFFAEGIATTHGTPYSYDTHVPVIFMGAGAAKGTFRDACSPADIAPTLSSILGLTAPSNSEGRVLVQAIR